MSYATDMAAFNTDMTNLGAQIRELGETTGNKTIAQMTTLVDTANSEIDSQSTLIGQIITALDGKSSGTDTRDGTATENDILASKTAYVDGDKLTGTIPTKTASDLTSSGARVTVPAGYYASSAYKDVNISDLVSGTYNIASTGAKDVTNYQYAQISDNNLIAENIAQGITILGVQGTHVGGASVTYTDNAYGGRTATIG